MAIQRRTLFSKLNTTLLLTLEAAAAFCRQQQHAYIEVAHWLDQLIQLPDSDLHHILRHYNLETSLISRQLSSALTKLPAGASAVADFSHHIDIAVERAWILTTLHTNDTSVRSAYVLAALLETPELQSVVYRIAPALSLLPKTDFIHTITPIIQSSTEAAPSVLSAEAETPNITHASPLQQYCVDLTELARQKKIDPVIGREQEIRTMMDILLRRRQNNPLLTGEAGVGKTAVVEGLALAIAQGNVPPSLQQHRLLSVDMGALLAGATMKGEFEARLKSVIDAAMHASPAVILFIDEVHTLVGAGGQEGTGDAANLLKPALARGALKTIGATTWREYKRHIEKDPALTRRFQVLQVGEPEVIQAIRMVRGLANTLASHHQVWLTDEAICAAVTLSHRYIPERQLPDKAISLLDTACARVALSLHTPPAIVTRLQEDITALHTEQAQLSAEMPATQKNSDRLTEIEQQIAELTAQRQAHETNWQQAQNIVQQIHHLRQQYQDAQPPEQQLIEQESRQLNEDLTALQQDAAFVYPQVNHHVVADIVSQWTGIPAGQIKPDQLSAVQTLPQHLAQRVIGQSHALTRISQCIQTACAGLTDTNKPIGVFLLTGPSGVGKTETALALSEALYGGEQNLITINMNEFQENYTVSTLKGAPPGYVGFGEGGILTEAVRRRPYSVVLLDEIEKAHPNVWELFYQAFDKGWMKDGEGRYIDFKNTIILLTSNACADLITQLQDDETTPPDVHQTEQLLLRKLTEVFPKAFLGRMNIIPYLPLKDDKLADILRLHLNKVTQRMAVNHDIALTFSDAVIAHILTHCKKQETGARHFIQYIERHILPSLSQHWIDAFSNQQRIQSIAMDIHEASLTYQITYH